MSDRDHVRDAIRRGLVSEEEAAALLSHWPLWRRPSQCPPPGDWRGWLLMGGAGSGKTRPGSEWVWEKARAGAKRLHLLGRTYADVRDTMIQGESGIQACARRGESAKFTQQTRSVTLQPYGTQCLLFTADEPEGLRGWQSEGGWADEVGTFRNGVYLWTLFEQRVRLGTHPQWVATTTGRNTELMRWLTTRPDVRITTATTFDNAENLPASFIELMRNRFKPGSPAYRREILGEIVDDVDGALWTSALIDSSRVPHAPDSLARIVVAVDPAVSSKDNADTCGIVVVGVDRRGHAYVLEDASGRYKVSDWLQRVVGLYHKWKADRVVAEVNNGGDLVEISLRSFDKAIAYKAVSASRGKAIRAEPVVQLYERGMVHHVGETPALDAELTTWVQGDPSPGRLDALVWACYDLALGSQTGTWSELATMKKPTPSKPSLPRY